MEASPARIVQFFDGKRQCIIPLFQRPYTWERKRWETLWDDILAHYETTDEGPSHFMGAVVTLPARTVPVGVSKFLIIDGQQRLTTIAALLLAIRDAVPDEKRESVQDDYLVNRHNSGEPDYLKLLPTQRDREAYSALIAGTPPPGGSRIADAKRFFAEVLRGQDGDGRRIDPLRVLQVVVTALQVVSINLGDADDPYLIFERLNYKGEPLTQADLIRNYILMRFRHSLGSGGDQERVHQRYWQPMEEDLGTALTDFLGHFVMLCRERSTRGAVYAAMKARLRDLDPAALESELCRMQTLSRHYAVFVTPGRESVAPVRAYLDNLKELKVTTIYPLLMRLFEYRASGHIADAGLQSALANLETLLVRRSVCGVPTNQLERIFSRWGRELPTDDTLGWLTDRIREGSGNRRCPSDREFRTALESGDLYHKDICRFILTSLERARDSREPADLSGTQTEHIMPQTLTDVWKADLGPMWQQDHEQLLHTLGNLTLSGYNAKLANAPFPEKRTNYAESHVDLTRGIAEWTAWTADQIRDRGARLATEAIGRWPSP